MVKLPDDITQEIAARVAPRLGLTPTAITFALTAAISIGANIFQHMTVFDKGWNAYEDAVREGTAKLDGKRFDIMTEVDAKLIASQARADAILEMQGQINTTYETAIQGINNAHSDKVTQPIQPLAPDAVKWGDVDIPDSERVRFDLFDRKRLNRDGGGTDATTDSDTILAGYPTSDTPSPGAKKR